MVSSRLVPVTMGELPGRPLMMKISRLVALPTSRKPISTRVRLRSSMM